MALDPVHQQMVEKDHAYREQAQNDAALVVCGAIEDDDFRLEVLQMLGLIPDKEKED